MSDDALAIQNQQDELLQNGGLGFEDSYIRPTNMLLVQNSTVNVDAIKGKLFDELTGTNLDEIEVVPLLVNRGRALFPTGKLGQTPICRSDNGIVPSPDAQFKQADLCAKCSKSSWADYDRETKKGKPTCQEKWQLLFIWKETGLPRRLSIGGMSLTPFKKVLEQINQDAVMAKAKGEPKRNIFDYTFKISSLMVQGGAGNYYVAKFSNVKRVLDSTEYGPMYMQYVVSDRARREAAAEAKENNEAVSEVLEGEVVI